MTKNNFMFEIEKNINIIIINNENKFRLLDNKITAMSEAFQLKILFITIINFLIFFYIFLNNYL
jgi:hypothetical protein